MNWQDRIRKLGQQKKDSQKAWLEKEKKDGAMMMKIKKTGIKLTDYKIDFKSVGDYKWNTGKGMKWENLKFNSDILNIATISISEIKKICKTDL